MYSPYPEPPTQSTLSSARLSLSSQQSQHNTLSIKIEAAELALAQIIADSKCAIREMQRDRALLEDQLALTRAYVAPIRRLPHELLRQVFMWNFRDYPCCAWVIAAVCPLWRRLALGMPKMWSKIRLVTTQNSSADTIRLWLERSGDTVPLDIEIFLRVSGISTSEEPRVTSVRSSSPSWTYPHTQNTNNSTITTATTTTATNSPIPPTYIISQPSHMTMGIPVLPPSHTPIIIPPSPSHHDPWSSPPPSSPVQAYSPGLQNKASMHWGHISIFYLVAQMHRWKRFVFRFDKQFASMAALKSITGDAPLLDEFEISSAEPAFYNTEWPWLPSAPSTSSILLPRLKSLTLQYTPFKWSSPILKTNLTSLTLRALPTNHLQLDRILAILANNPALERLSLHFASVLTHILPLSPLTLPDLKEMNLGGHFLMSQLTDSLILPVIESLTFDIEARDPIEDTLSNLLTRSSSPPLKHLSVAYGSASSSSYYYGSGGVVISWAFLADLAGLETLHVGGTPFEPLLSALGPPDEDTPGMAGWVCPNLVSLGMKNCHSHSEGVAKLVQMVEARNPDSAGGYGSVNGVTPKKLGTLELYECANLGGDVVRWLEGRVRDVVCTEPPYDRSGYFIRASMS